MSTSPPTDVLLVGGGLANSLIALDFHLRRPDLRLTMLDESAEPVEHTWSIFDSDLEQEGELAALFDHRWRGYSVAFPALSRGLSTGYSSLTSTRLRQHIKQRLGDRLVCRKVVRLCGSHAECEDGETFSAPLVIDGRGARPSRNLELGWQKFVGLEVELRRPHGLSEPIVMDATVRQEDGFRFLYVLPTGPSRLMIEDTRYSDGADLDRVRLEGEVLRYARGRGWSVAEVVRREQGVLPVVLGGDIEAFWNEPGREAVQVGMRGAFFHPTTGYSFPDALRTARLVVDHADEGGPALRERLRTHSIALWRERGFYRLLNRMLFQAAEPDQRYRVLERFYRLPQPLIERFYAGRSTLADKVRILSGKPPVPIFKAVKAAAQPWTSHAPV
ncbi:lycopene beta-cyclase CrtY [Phenylobacterium deserti]|uniref:Lycopene cyclase n=1 Tax=Phenylobacterium deserti TaxID=1914756 RepID=A0A328AGD3_9CAUL|nr:lycopene beta-cyclase CrtY [Phenylobacterium deserti]RAK52504.1 lycopene cyclase [Phenylobacterium deserti]